MLTRRRLLIAAPVLILVLAAAYLLWLALQVRHDLHVAESDATRLRSAIDARDPAARDRALADLQDSAASADDHTAGVAWSLVTHLPLVGDDATGVRALSSSLDEVATDGIPPLVDVLDDVRKLPTAGGVDLARVRAISGPLTRAHAAFARAEQRVGSLDSSGYAGSVRGQFDHYADLVGEAADALASARTASEVLPTILGGDGPQNYLLVFQNNAEIRSTGGIAGSWALMHADGGKLSLRQQGSALDFPHPSQPVTPLTEQERIIFHDQLGTYWQDANFTPDFPRAARIWQAHWDRKFPSSQLDGVISVDPVALSYLIGGIGPIHVGDTTLTRNHLVQQLLNQPYLSLSKPAQDLFFQRAAGAIFERATHHLRSPVDLVRGLQRAADEGRLLVSAFNQSVADQLAGAEVEGALSGDDGRTPHVDIDLNDATGSKMSYYLRYSAHIDARSCARGRQTFDGSLTLNQSISPEDASKLPVSVTGGGNYGTEPGSQLVVVNLYSPFDGTIGDVQINGRRIDVPSKPLNGRQVFTAVVLLASADDVVLTWTMHSGPGQTGDARLGMTPSVVPGNSDAVIASAC